MHPHQFLWLRFGLLSTLSSFIWPMTIAVQRWSISWSWTCHKQHTALNLLANSLSSSGLRIRQNYTQECQDMCKRGRPGLWADYDVGWLARINAWQVSLLQWGLPMHSSRVLPVHTLHHRCDYPDIFIVYIGLNQIYLYEYRNGTKETWILRLNTMVQYLTWNLHPLPPPITNNDGYVWGAEGLRWWYALELTLIQRFPSYGECTYLQFWMQME